MTFYRFLMFFLIGLFFSLSVFSENKIITYAAPEGALLNDHFAVKVRIPGNGWEEIPVYLVLVDEVQGGKHVVKKSSMTFLSEGISIIDVDKIPFGLIPLMPNFLRYSTRIYIEWA